MREKKENIRILRTFYGSKYNFRHDKKFLRDNLRTDNYHNKKNII